MLTRASLNGLASRFVARGPPVAHPCKPMTVVEVAGVDKVRNPESRY